MKNNQTHNNKKTVLFILHLPPPVHGAAMVGQYIKDSEVVNEAFNCHYINLTTATSLEDIGKGGVKKLWRFVRMLQHIRREVKRLKPQLVYITPNAAGIAFYKDFIVMQMLKGLGCKVLAHYHNKGVVTRQDCRLDDWLYRRFFKNLKVMLLADVLYDDVKKYVKRENVYICPNGIPEMRDYDTEIERHNDVPHLLFLSNLLVAKGVLVLLDALQILKERGCSFVCNFVGGETAEIDAARFEREVESRGLNAIALYHGRKFGKDKEPFFANADIFILPTSNECFPLVLLEAMEYELPCIATRVGGIPDILQDGVTGRLCPPKDAKSLADSIEQLINDEAQRLRMGKAGRKRYEERFTQQHFENNITTILKDLTKSY